MEVIIRPEDHNPEFSDKWINLAEERLGTKVLFATDDFFAEKENLIKPGRGIFVEDKYTDNGKWMDGWESRRKRTEGHDHCIIRLGLSGIIKGVDIDTNFFTGNHPASASIEACCIEGDPDEGTQWTEVLSEVNLNPGSQHLHQVNSGQRWTHVKLHIYPDGGVARLRIYGEVRKDWEKVGPDVEIDLAAVENEGKALVCSDMYFSHKDNINAPGRGVNMGDGWETKRRRGPGHDWLLLALGKKGLLSKIIVDTAHFKGNYPDRFSLEGAQLSEGLVEGVDNDATDWISVLGETKLEADKIHQFDSSEFKNNGPFTHMRLRIYPDGGVSRLRVLGTIQS